CGLTTLLEKPEALLKILGSSGHFATLLQVRLLDLLVLRPAIVSQACATDIEPFSHLRAVYIQQQQLQTQSWHFELPDARCGIQARAALLQSQSACAFLVFRELYANSLLPIHLATDISSG